MFLAQLASTPLREAYRTYLPPLTLLSIPTYPVPCWSAWINTNGNNNNNNNNNWSAWVAPFPGRIGPIYPHLSSSWHQNTHVPVKKTPIYVVIETKWGVRLHSESTVRPVCFYYHITVRPGIATG